MSTLVDCGACGRTAGRRVFCPACGLHLGDPAVGRKAGPERRAAALVAEVAAVWALNHGMLWLLAADQVGLAFALGVAATAYLVWWGWLKRTGRRPGKALLGLRVVHAHTGRPAGFVRMLLRDTLGHALSAAGLGLGFAWALHDPDGRAWHDYLFGTAVVAPADANGPALVPEASYAPPAP